MATGVLLAAMMVMAVASGHAHRLSRLHIAEADRDTATRHHQRVARLVLETESQREDRDIPPQRRWPGPTTVASVEAQLAEFHVTLPPAVGGWLAANRGDASTHRFSHRAGERFSPFVHTATGRVTGGLFPEQSLENPTAWLIDTFDVTFVIVYILPLVILALTYDIVSGEREAGTLGLVASQPIRVATWLWARLLARALLCAFAVLPPMVAAAVVGAPPSWSAALVTVTAAMAIVVIYAAFWFAAAMAVNVAGGSSATNALVMAGAWLLLVAVVPAGVDLASRALRDPGLRAAFADRERRLSLIVNPQVDAAMAAINQIRRERWSAWPLSLMAASDHPSFTEPLDVPEAGPLIATLRRGQPHWPEALSANELTRALAEYRRMQMEDGLAPLVAALDADAARQRRVSALAALASPAAVAQVLLDDWAGVSERRHRAFMAQLDAFLRARSEWFAAKALQSGIVSSTEIAALEPFRFVDESTMARLRHSVTGMVGLLVPLLLVLIRATRRTALPIH